eukprot:GHRR01001201.1.p1 GENE.GHRR01001201.1~~GHRR01001201.1.p1  ORF type:complete len:156 (+),score=31.42 GHRR01001201.1:228-695(+)
MQCVHQQIGSRRATHSRLANSGRPQIIGKLHVCVVAPRPWHANIAARQPKQLVRSTQPDTEEARSPLDAPQEWEAPQPSRRPDIFPEFEKMERVFLPKPLPGDPEMPDEEEEESRKRTEPGDPDPEAPPGEPSEPEVEPDGDNPEKQPNIPTVPE